MLFKVEKVNILLSNVIKKREIQILMGFRL